MPEELALTEEVEDTSVVDQLDRSPADDSHLVLGPFALSENRRPGAEELDLDPLRELLEGARIQSTERIVLPQELSNVVRVRSIIVRGRSRTTSVRA